MIETEGARAVAIFGGSFNPPHVAHVMTVSYLLSRALVDRVLVMPTYQHAFGKDLASFEDRLALCEGAFSLFKEGVMISDLERRLGGESRTIRLVDALKGAKPDLGVSLVIGSDLVREVPRWKESRRLLAEASLLVLERGGYPHSDCIGPRLPEVSSSEVRALLGSGELEAASRFLPESVCRTIQDRGLYGVEE